MEMIFKDKAFTATMDKNNKSFFAKQVGFVGTEEIKKYWLKIRDLILQNRIEKLFIDGSETKVMPVDAQKWFETEYFPSVAHLMAGRKLKIAQLQSEDVFSQLVGVKINKMANQVTTGMQMQIFGNKQLAEEWLAA